MMENSFVGGAEQKLSRIFDMPAGIKYILLHIYTFIHIHMCTFIVTHKYKYIHSN